MAASALLRAAKIVQKPGSSTAQKRVTGLSGPFSEVIRPKIHSYPSGEPTLELASILGAPMLKRATTAIVRGVLDKVFKRASRSESRTPLRTNLQVVEPAATGDALRRVHPKGFSKIPTMWR
jgi:hypothetical protein